MSGRKKLIRNIIVAVVVIALLAAGYYFATVWEPTKPNDNIDAPEIEDVITLYVPDGGQVRSVYIKNPEQTYTLVKNDEGEISIPELPNIPFIQMELRSAMSALSSVTALNKITDDVSRIADFGLAEPNGILTVTLKDGTAKNFFIGDSLPGSDDYYIMEKGGDAIYTFSSFKAKTFFAPTDDYRSTSLFSLGSIVYNVTVSKDNDVILSVRSKRDDEVTQNITTTSWIMETPCPGEGVAEDRFASFLDNYKNVEIIEFVDDKPTDLSKYGLGSGAYTVSIDDGTAHTIKLGKRTENGVYMQYGADPFVYLGSLAYIDAIENTDPVHYVSKFVHVVSIDDIKSIKVEKGVKIFVLENNNNAVEDFDDKYKLNGKSTTVSEFKKAYQQVIGITYVDQTTAGKNNSPFMTITYNFKDGKSDTTKYYDFDERFYIAERSNGKRLTVLKTTLTDLFNMLNK